MTVLPPTLAAFVVVGVACSASLATSHSDPPGPVLACELRLSQSGQTVTVTAMAQAPRATRGTYTLHVQQAGAGGRVTIRQSGEVDLQPGARVLLGDAQFTGHARDLSAELTLEADGQQRTCTDFSL